MRIAEVDLDVGSHRKTLMVSHPFRIQGTLWYLRSLTTGGVACETGRNCLGLMAIFNVGAQVEILRIPADLINHFFPWLDVGHDSFDRDTST